MTQVYINNSINLSILKNKLGFLYGKISTEDNNVIFDIKGLYSSKDHSMFDDCLIDGVEMEKIFFPNKLIGMCFLDEDKQNSYFKFENNNTNKIFINCDENNGICSYYIDEENNIHKIKSLSTKY
ncbi:MAG: hypothetical protein ACK5HL_03990 [Bacilli bacterium]